MDNLLLKSALEYRNEFKFSLIPFRNDKTPYLKVWKEYENRLPTEKEIVSWWSRWPDAIIALVCGRISNIFLIDFDTYRQKNEKLLNIMMELIPYTIPGPIANTPSGGFHRYFSIPEDQTIQNLKSNELCIDIKGEGGLAFVPPSFNGNGNHYTWHTGRSIHDVALEPLSIILYNNILKAFNNNYKGDVMPPKNDGIDSHNISYQSITKHNIDLEEGSRDESLFHIANSLVRGGMEQVNIEKCLEIIGNQCNPPFPDRELKSKISSAIQRAKTKERNLTEEIRQFVGITNGYFSVTDACQSITMHNKPQVRVILHRLTQGKTPILEKDPKKDGWFRRIEKTIEEVNWIDSQVEEIRVKYPFAIDRQFITLPKNIIVVAGTSDSGKTAFLLNFVDKNMWDFKNRIHYFSSEMGPIEMKVRAAKFGYDLEFWRDKFKFYERSADFDQVIMPDDINIIDYLDITDEFYKIGEYIKRIFDKLNKGICIIALQKNPEREHGLGGMRSIEKARLYLSIDPGVIKIVKCKNWRTEVNPNGLFKRFKLIEGCKFKEDVRGWDKEIKQTDYKED